MAHATPHHNDEIEGMVGTLATTLAGATFSALFGAGFSLLALFMMSFFITISFEYWFVAFLILWTIVGFTLMDEGLKYNVQTGSVGVPSFLGTRLKSFCLAEGKHWMIPGLMDKADVDVRVKTLTLDEVVGLSKDKVLMRALFVLKVQVKNPFRFLSADEGFASLRAVAESPVREIFSANTMDDLLVETQKKDIGKAVDDALSGIALRDFGIDVGEVFEPEIRPPANIEAEYAKIKIEEAQAKSEKVELDNITLRVADLMEIKGMTADKAYEIIQTERGKSTLNRQVFRIEGADRIGDIIAGVIQAFLNKKGA